MHGPANTGERTLFHYRRVTGWALLLGFWLLIILASAAQMYYSGPVPWAEALHVSVRDWGMWAVLSPLILWLSARYPIERKTWKRSVPIHLASCAVCVIAFEAAVFQLPSSRVHPLGDVRPIALAPPALPPPRGIGGPPEGMAISVSGPPEMLHVMPFDRSPLQELLSIVFFKARFNVPIYWIIVSMSHAVGYYRRANDRERRALELESHLAKARLQSLQQQLHPHFLFNTLNAISTLVHEDPDAADEMIGSLSELLRIVLATSNEQEVSLRRELEFLDHYLQIQRVRFGDRLQIEKEIDPAALNAMVPSLVLQPLVENAIRHGIEPQLGPGTVFIQAQKRGSRLHLAVKDNGRGLADHPMKEGIGISNTKLRLLALHGKDQQLCWRNAAPSGLVVEIDFPYREETQTG